MAGGTGLPLPRSRGNTSQPARLTPPINASKWSTDEEWNMLAQAGRQLQATGFGIADEARQEARREELEARAGYMAEQENEIAAKRIELADKYHLDPEGFKAEWGAYVESKQGGAEKWARPGLTKALAGAGNSAYSSILTARRNEDRRLNTERLNTMIARDGDDVVGAAMAGQMGTPDWEAKVAKLQGSLDSAVNLRLMPQEKADEIRDDVSSRAHGEVATRAALTVYREKGREAAIQHLRSSILENASSSLSPTQKQAVYNKGLSAIELQRQIDGQDRAEYVAAATDVINGLDAGQTPDPVQLSSLSEGLKRTGAMGTYLRLQSKIAIKNATAPFAALAPADALTHLDRIESRGASIGPQLAMAESGGRADAVNQFGYAGRYQFGAPRLAELGVYRPGPGEDLATWSKTGREGKWTGEFNIQGFPQVKTLQDFLGNERAQEAVMQQQVQKANQEIDARGMDRFIGQTVGGTVVTRAGLQAMIHLGGPGSAQSFLESGGQTNPADANGRSVGDYLKLGETAEDRAQPMTGTVAKQVQAAFVSQVRKDWPEIKAQIERGQPADPKAMAAMLRAAELSGDGAWKREVAAVAAAQRGNQVMQGLTVSEGQQGIDNLAREFMADGSMSVDEQRVIDSLRQSFNLKLKQIAEDPVAYAQAQGAPQPPPLDFSNPDAARAAVTARVNLARGVADANRVAAGSPFGEADRRAIAGAINGPDPRQAGVAMDALFALPDEMITPALTKDVRDAVVGAGRSPDATRYNAAMGFLDKMFQRAPATTKDLFGSQVLGDLAEWQTHRRYLNGDQLAKQREVVDPGAQKIRDANRAEGLKEARKYDAGQIVSQFDDHPWVPFVGVPNAPVDPLTRDALMADWSTLYADHFARTGSKDEAAAYATKMARTVWSASAVNGGRLMMHAPETKYPAIDGKHDWMKAQADRDVEAMVGKPMVTKTEVNPGGIGGDAPVRLDKRNYSYTLVSDAQTEREVSRGVPPSYQVVVIDGQTGEMKPLAKRLFWDTYGVLEEARDKFQRERDRIIGSDRSREEMMRRMGQAPYARPSPQASVTLPIPPVTSVTLPIRDGKRDALAQDR